MNNCYSLSLLNTIADEACRDAQRHGLWEPLEALNDGHDRHACARLIRDEAEEAMLAATNRGHYAEELADVVIMALSASAYLGIDIAAEVGRKMAINRGRPWKHGKVCSGMAGKTAEEDQNQH